MAALGAAAVERARSRRASQAAARQVRTEWFIQEVSQTVRLSLRERSRLATNYLKDRVVQNISTPVVRITGPRGGMHVERSKPGEFPRADTTQLMKSIFARVEGEEGHVGTNLEYGAILELKERSFLVRTFNEELPTIRKIMSGPIK